MKADLERYHQRLRAYGSLLSRRTPVELHHVIGGSITARIGERGTRKRSDWLVIPLTHDEHQPPDGVHGGVETWEKRYGVTEAELIDRLCKIFRLDLWALAAQEAQAKRAARRGKRSSKILPHPGVL